MRRLAAVLALLAVGACDDAPAVSATRAPIIGGRPTDATDVYGTVAVIRQNGLATTICSGTLVRPDVVLTAAHCVLEIDGATLTVTGAVPVEQLSVKTGPTREPPPGVSVPIVRAVAHPGFLPGPDRTDPQGLGDRHDVALVFTATAITDVEVVPILDAADVDGVLVPGAPLTISGYGVRSGGFIDMSGSRYIAETSMLRRTAGDFVTTAGQPDACSGDSGGPVYVFVGGAPFLVGATSRTRSDATADCDMEGGVFTIVPTQHAWLDSELGMPDAGVADGGGPSPADAGPAVRSTYGCGCTVSPPPSCATWPVCAAALALLTLRRRRRRAPS